jgi:hypothetical protein
LERTFNSTQTTTIYVSKSQFYYYTYNSAYYIYRVTAETIYSSNLSADGLSWVSEGSSGSPKNIGNATEPKVRIKYSTTDILTGTQTAPGTGVYFAANIGLGVRTEDLPQIPSSDMQYYIVYEDIENNDYYKYEFETVSVFDVGTCYDADEKIYDINFYGNGKYKIYKLDKTDTAALVWEMTEENVRSYESQGGLKKHIIYNNFTIPLDSDHGGGGISFDDSATFTEGAAWKVLNPATPIHTTYNKVRVQLKINTNTADIEPGEAEYYLSGGVDADIVDTTWQGWGDRENGQIQYIETVTMDIYLGVNPEDVANITVRANAVIPEKKGWFGIITRQRQEFTLTFDIIKTAPTDTNQDGKDDVTGETGNWEQDQSNLPTGDGDGPPDRAGYDTDLVGNLKYLTDTLMYWMTSPFRFLGEGIQYLLDVINETLDWVGDFIVVVGRLFSFLPAPVMNMIGLAFDAMIIIAVVKMIRG